ncbi:hypothetical protein GCM10009775_04060 [Microbacterium aoyamense]|uniref:HTH luxR-type domain-containing protein n=1 Tax=Microbacterium aoyamense TaxID=344166 RepID=A0ABN2PBE3_9MICO|nr:helix-turn-helix transcriptional regulator [Microbacterium aoyamense]
MISRPFDLFDPLLQRVLTSRPTSVTELSELAGSIGWDGQDALATLEDLGIAEQSDGELRITDPVRALAARAARALEAQRQSIDETATLLAAIPHLMNHSVAEPTGAGSDRMIGDIVRGHDEVWESWWRNSAHLQPNRPGVVTPDAVMLKGQVLEDIERVAADFIERGFHMRVILDIEECFGPEGDIEPWLQAQLDAGVEVRAMSDPPSWFYVDDGVIGGIPLTWGQGNPAGMVILHDSPLLALAAAFFESLWTAAIPIGGTVAGWEPVLELLAIGRSDKQIADALGLSLRTVRRRIAEAMDDLRAPTRFELGAAWARRAS